MNAPRGRSLALLALLVLLTLAGCNRNGGTTVDTAAPAASAASAPAPAASAPVAAAPPLVPTDVPLVAAGAKDDPEPGRQLATSGAQGVAACAGCHGAAGEGNAQAGFPRLAGLGKQYLVHQLESYADGSRVNPIMQPIATAMTPAQRQASAVFYSLGAPAAATGATGASAPATAPSTARAAPTPAGGSGGRGTALADRGDETRGVQACVNCHGRQGMGDAAANPYLAGQHATYLSAALAAWKDGSRKNDPSGQMPAIAKALTDEDVKAVVGYYARLAPPAPRNAQAAPALPDPTRPAVQSGPVTATAPQQGIGTEQGALTGGSQGQGSGGAATNPADTPNAPAGTRPPAASASR